MKNSSSSVRSKLLLFFTYRTRLPRWPRPVLVLPLPPLRILRLISVNLVHLHPRHPRLSALHLYRILVANRPLPLPPVAPLRWMELQVLLANRRGTSINKSRPPNPHTPDHNTRLLEAVRRCEPRVSTLSSSNNTSINSFAMILAWFLLLPCERCLNSKTPALERSAGLGALHLRRLRPGGELKWNRRMLPLLLRLQVTLLLLLTECNRPNRRQQCNKRYENYNFFRKSKKPFYWGHFEIASIRLVQSKARKSWNQSKGKARFLLRICQGPYSWDFIRCIRKPGICSVASNS